MKLRILTLALSVLILSSCGGEEVSNKVVIDPNGPDVEVNVLEFEQENRKTKIEIINRMDNPIKSIRGRLYFHGESGEVLTTNTGRELSSPFSYAKNPSIVGSMARTEYTLGNDIPEGTFSISIEEIAGKTTEGEF